MALTIKNLAIGTLGLGTFLSPGTIILGSTAKSTLIKNIILTNTGTGPRKVNICVKAGGTTTLYTAQITQQDLQIPANSQIVINEEITLAFTTLTGVKTAEGLYGWADNASDVKYVVNGVERDL